MNQWTCNNTPDICRPPPSASVRTRAPCESFPRPCHVISGSRSALWQVPGEQWALLARTPAPTGLVSVNCSAACGVTGNELSGWWGRLDWAAVLLHTVYTCGRLNSLTISLEMCYCSLLKDTDRGHFSCWMAPPPLGITMKASALGCRFRILPRVLPVQVGREVSSSHSVLLHRLPEAANWLKGFPVMKAPWFVNHFSISKWAPLPR